MFFCLINNKNLLKSMKTIEIAKLKFSEGLYFFNTGKFNQAENLFLEALTLSPNRVSILINLAASQIKQKKFVEAKKNLEVIITNEQQNIEAYLNLGTIALELNEIYCALDYFNNAIKLDSQYAEAFFGRSNYHFKIGNYEEALNDIDQALCLKNDYYEAVFNKALILNKLNRYEEALVCFKFIYQSKSEFPYLLGQIISTKRLSGNWDDINLYVCKLLQDVSDESTLIAPFHFLSLIDSPRIQLIVSKAWTRNNYSNINRHKNSIKNKNKNKNKIRVGYYSADFYCHATAYLMMELFELHNKNLFEIFAFSYSPRIHDECKQRLLKSFDDNFIDILDISDLKVAELSRNLNIDIAIDLKGYTENGRPSIFAYGAAPIQVNYLGYPGTLGAEFYDYIIADKLLIPKESREFYSEKIIYLPNSYQSNDSKRFIPINISKRIEHNLPEDKFVYCCFNNNYKISSIMLDSWTRILQRIENSVLWLLADNNFSKINLIKEFNTRGISSNRIIFSNRCNYADHLARHELADLFLDTFPYNAHTTASDALWSGLPVITLQGKAFASRVASSLLSAIQLSELITNDIKSYELLAIDLAVNNDKLKFIKNKLLTNRHTCLLFDTVKFIKHYETALFEINKNFYSGLPLEDIYIDTH